MPEHPSGEYTLLAAIRKVLGPVALAGAPYDLTLGDDAALRKGRSGERVVLTTDIAVENVHFSLSHMSMAEIGYRVIAANVSDCAAMAAYPESALVQLVFPQGSARITDNVVALYRGIARACRRWNCRVIGGDLAGGAHWTIGITMLGTVPARGKVLERKGALPGDTLWLSGFPGESAAGLAALQKRGRREAMESCRRLVLRHIRPEPSPDLGVALGRFRSVHAMMDLSDGLSKDARTMCHENGLGLDLILDWLRPPADMVTLADELGIPWQEWALHGGEEYTLLFAASPEFSLADLPKPFGKSLVRLGTFTGRHRDLVEHRQGKRIPVPRKSWDHVG